MNNSNYNWQDTWKHIYIGDARFTTMQLCGR